MRRTASALFFTAAVCACSGSSHPRRSSVETTGGEVAGGKQAAKLATSACSARGDSAPLTLLHVNDLQAHYSERVEGRSRYARIAGLIAGIKHDVPSTIALDAGDDYEKGSLADLRSGGAATRRVIHALPFDVRTLGNHDFAYGEAAVRADVQTSPYPVLAANVRDPSDPDLFRGFVKLEIGCIRVGVVGLVTHPYGSSDEQEFTSYGSFEHDPRAIAIADRIVKEHRREVDVMIALTHLGKSPDIYLAREVPGIDVVIGAHTEDTITRPIRVFRPDNTSAIVLQAGHFGETVGRADLTVSFRDSRVELERYRLLPVDTTATADPAIDQLVTRVETETVPRLFESVATFGRERSPRELCDVAASAAGDVLGADAILIGKDAFWFKAPAGAISLQRLYDLTAAQKQPMGTAGFTSLWTVDLSADELARLKARMRKDTRFVFSQRLATPGATPKKTFRLALEKRLLEHPQLAVFPVQKWPEAKLGGELVDVFEKYGRAQATRGASIDAVLGKSDAL